MEKIISIFVKYYNISHNTDTKLNGLSLLKCSVLNDVCHIVTDPFKYILVIIKNLMDCILVSA